MSGNLESCLEDDCTTEFDNQNLILENGSLLPYAKITFLAPSTYI